MNKSSLHFQMLRIRMIEQEIARRYKEQQMRCPVHLSIGQEAAAVGICAALTNQDKMVSTHRGHAHYLAKGGSLVGLIGELYGKSIGCSRGNGGSMHLVDLSCGFEGSTSIVGGTIPIGVGLAWAAKLKGETHTTVICIGDAAVEEGVFHEAANFSSLHNLNVIFACENNRYSCFTKIKERQAERPLSEIAEAHDLNYTLTKPNDVEDIRVSMYSAKIEWGPSFIEIPTYRFVEHCGPEQDDHLGYRPEEEVKYWKDLDPLLRPTHPDDVMKIEREIKEAWAKVETSPYPDQEEIGKYIYADC